MRRRKSNSSLKKKSAGKVKDTFFRRTISQLTAVLSFPDEIGRILLCCDFRLFLLLLGETFSACRVLNQTEFNCVFLKSTYLPSCLDAIFVLLCSFQNGLLPSTRCNRTKQRPGPDNDHTPRSLRGPKISGPGSNQLAGRSLVLNNF